MKKSALLILLFAFWGISFLFAEVRLPAIFSDNMILQRDQPVSLWGWADKNEKIEIVFNGQRLTAIADRAGNWKVMLNPMTYGGPYTLEVRGKKNVLVKENILIGDVWLCSGQSNMEWIVSNSMNAKKEMCTADYSQIRSFNVVHEMSFMPEPDFKGHWDICTPSTVGDFSAVAYFFARKLYQETGIPIGIINSSWGGTDIETWISPDVFSALPDKFMARYNAVRQSDPEKFLAENIKNKFLYDAALKNDLGLQKGWQNPSTDISGWGDLPVPQIWTVPDLENIDGVVWIQYDLLLPESVTGEPALISLGKIDDNDDTWINGVKVGATEGYNIPRLYNVSPGVLKPGVNRISVRIVDTAAGGGVYGTPEEVYLEVNQKKYFLSGIWKYKLAESNKKYNYTATSPNFYPSLLYNAMIHPIVRLAMKGVIWYQGENNAEDAYSYRTLFPTLINDWRNKWGYEFPFYWVQLANYMASDEQPRESSWAELREAQTMTLSLPRTGQAVIIDIGDAGDIHPRNKQDVGVRLALHALKNDYGREDLIVSGPVFKSFEVTGNKITITFDHIGSGLDIRNKYGYLSGFSIAGNDKNFVWAKAYISGDKVIVYSDRVENPVAVRYDWSNNPDGNLYNKEGLPACPFRTDIWEISSEKK